RERRVRLTARRRLRDSIERARVLRVELGDEGFGGERHAVQARTRAGAKPAGRSVSVPPRDREPHMSSSHAPRRRTTVVVDPTARAAAGGALLMALALLLRMLSRLLIGAATIGAVGSSAIELWQSHTQMSDLLTTFVDAVLGAGVALGAIRLSAADEIGSPNFLRASAYAYAVLGVVRAAQLATGASRIAAFVIVSGVVGILLLAAIARALSPLGALTRLAARFTLTFVVLYVAVRLLALTSNIPDAAADGLETAARVTA